jgi:hypothetical protein
MRLFVRSLPFQVLAALAAVTIISVITGCSSAPVPSASTAAAGTPAPQPSGIATLLQKGAALVAKDTAAAEADAVAHNDAVSQPCYPAINTWVQGLAPASGTSAPVAGLFSAQQKLRDLASQPGFTVPVAVRLACAALLMDDATFIAKFDLFVATGVASGGSSVGAAAINAVLPVPLPAIALP